MSWERVFAFATAYGYAFLFVVSIAENLFLLGFVVPGDLAVVAAGALAARGYLHPVQAAVSIVLGVVVGSCLSFWLGRRGGTALIERWAARFTKNGGKTRTAEEYFISHGAKTVFVASFVAGLKNTVPAVAGAANMSFSRFLIYNAAGSTLRALGLMAIGWIFGANLERALGVMGSLNGWVFGVLAVVGAVVFFIKWSRGRRRARGAGTKSEDRVDREPIP